MFTVHDRNPRRAIIRIQNQLNLTSTWFIKWRLKVNSIKTVVILFNKQSTNKCPKLSIQGHKIPWSTTVKYLGVTLNKNLSFKHHMQNNITKATRTQGMLYPILNKKSPIPMKIKLQIYNTYIKPIITYLRWSSVGSVN